MTKGYLFRVALRRRLPGSPAGEQATALTKIDVHDLVSIDTPNTARILRHLFPTLTPFQAGTGFRSFFGNG
jgi:hypothetical protein